MRLLTTAILCLAFMQFSWANKTVNEPKADAQAQARTILHLLDYVGVDYAGAVEGGKIKSADEYKEMLEFTAQANERMAELPDNPQRAALITAARHFSEQVRDKAPPTEIASTTRALRYALVSSYDLILTPRNTPDLARGRAIYAQQCAACHGAEGRGDGPAAKGLDPAPANFHDSEHFARRSTYGLFSTITLGVDGTAMTAFKSLSDDDRWALAFLVSTMATPDARLAQGKKTWETGAAQEIFSDLGNVATLSPNEVAAKYDAEMAPVQDYLRAHPEAIAAQKPAPIAFARTKLAEASAAYTKGDHQAARDAAIQSYLEGFELAETSLANIDGDLIHTIERKMIDLRAAIQQGESPERFSQRVREVDALLATAQEKLNSGELSPASAFAGSLIILLREGLEAILVLAAIIAFVVKTERRDALPWVHAGWIAALALGGVTWVAATFLIDISGANREMTEGITALLAAAMLLYVGHWLHGKSYAAAWNRFIRDSVGVALSKRTLWAMAGVSFLAVYREVFEIILFYEALWAQAGTSGHGAVLGGIVAAAILLAACGFAILKYSVRLPIGAFFGATSALLALMAAVFAGHGVAALQEAGVIGVTRLGFNGVPLLGIYPSYESIGGQLVVLALVLLSFWAARRSSVTESRAGA